MRLINSVLETVELPESVGYRLADMSTCRDVYHPRLVDLVIKPSRLQVERLLACRHVHSPGLVSLGIAGVRLQIEERVIGAVLWPACRHLSLSPQ